jgi:hypothetical protein
MSRSSSLVLLCLALVLLLVAHPAHGRRALKRGKKGNKPPTSAHVNQPKMYYFPPLSFECSYDNQYRGARLKAAGAATLTFTDVTNTAPSTDTYDFCTSQCIQAWTALAPCVGFVRTAANTCALAISTPDQSTAAVFKVNPQFQGYMPTAVLLAPSCFAPMFITEAPTSTASPVSTATPTTGAPSTCPNANLPSGMSTFNKVPTDNHICGIAQVPSVGARFIRLDNFQCGLEGCIRWCFYDSACKYAMYSPKLAACIKATIVETTDDSLNWPAYTSQAWVAYARSPATGGDIAVRNRNGKCALLVPAGCKQDPECGWDKGPQGYNDYTMGGSAGGWCGRTSCSVYQQSLG